MFWNLDWRMTLAVSRRPCRWPLPLCITTLRRHNRRGNAYLILGSSRNIAWKNDPFYSLIWKMICIHVLILRSRSKSCWNVGIQDLALLVLLRPIPWMPEKSPIGQPIDPAWLQSQETLLTPAAFHCDDSFLTVSLDMLWSCQSVPQNSFELVPGYHLLLAPISTPFQFTCGIAM